jgi:hypothetical protein
MSMNSIEGVEGLVSIKQGKELAVAGAVGGVSGH